MPGAFRLDSPSAVLLVVGGLAFIAGGPLHPQGSNVGNKTQQLYSMLVEPLWYPAHAVSLLAMACIAAGLLAVRRQTGLAERARRVVSVAAWVAVVGAIGAVIHMFAATQASAIEDGGTTPLVTLFTGVETLVNPVWGLTIAVLAVVGGVTRALGNRIVLPLGLVGGLAFALATATIAFVDTLEPLFPVASLVGIWAVAVGVVGRLRSA